MKPPILPRCTRPHRASRWSHPLAPTLRLLVALILGTATSVPLTADAAPIRVFIRDSSSTNPMPCRIHLTDMNGKAVRAPGLPFWRDHFACRGFVDLDVPAGTYHYEIERGPEYLGVTNTVDIPESGLTIRHALTRITHLSSEGWWSGDLHIHRPIDDLDLLMESEDLNVGHAITWWNEVNPWTGKPLPDPPLLRLGTNRMVHLLAGEDERGGGALLYLNRSTPLEITASRRNVPPSVDFLRAARSAGNVHIDIEKPFWLDLPVWLADGGVDTVGIAHNHMHRAGVLENEAWGRPRELNRFPGPQGNGRYTQDIYYQILNAGFRIPPSAGSASGVLPNPPGYNRVYVACDGPLDWNRWHENLRAGRSFVSNGPLLRCRANGQLPGHVFVSEGPLQINLEGRLDSRDPIQAVELVHNGRIERCSLPGSITLHESGWFLIRAIADVPWTFRFASTAPWYVDIAAKPAAVDRNAAQFFARWVDDRIATLRNEDPADRERILLPWRAAADFWNERVSRSRPRTAITGRITDAATGLTIPARLEIQGADGTRHLAASTGTNGSAVRYEKRSWINPRAEEFHVTLPASPFAVELEPGRYLVTAERGKEYRPVSREISVGTVPVDLELPLERWIRMADRGWFSGDTHVHRPLEDLPNIALAEDLNVSFPMTYWVTRGMAPPTQGDKAAGADTTGSLVRFDDTHVAWPRNTEWEIFTLDGKPHTLGAVFALGHSAPIPLGAPPVVPIAEAAHRDGALLDLDKHDWPWAAALVPLMRIDLYELANNHLWRTDFAFTNWNSPAPPYMQLPNQGRHGGENDWTEYTHRTYWSLLNCGFRLQPCAGTANGVHPVPLGFGRVYVHCPGGFSYTNWIAGLRAGRSFVTTGPMIFAQFDARRVEGTVVSDRPVREIEVIINGELRHRLPLAPIRNPEGGWESSFAQELPSDATRWAALRCWENRDGRLRFAHTAPHWHDVPGAPLRPRREEVEFFIQRVREQINRSQAVLPTAAINEYRQALAIYENLLPTAR